jgi:hypothetical protein
VISTLRIPNRTAIPAELQELLCTARIASPARHESHQHGVDRDSLASCGLDEADCAVGCIQVGITIRRVTEQIALAQGFARRGKRSHADDHASKAVDVALNDP